VRCIGVQSRRKVLDPWPDGFERAYIASNRELYLHMAGPSEFAIVGTLRDWDVTDRLGEIHVPVLITCGEHDEMRPAHAKDMRRRMPNAEQRDSQFVGESV
jgi:pimeloyl-ACP methyl ester carboxylesterase